MCIFIGMPHSLTPFFKTAMGRQGYHAVSHNHNGCICYDNIYLHLNCPIKQFDNDKKLSYGFNVGLITPNGTSISNLSLMF